LNSVQHAAQDFHDRVRDVVHDLADPDMAWLEQLPEFQKIRDFEAWVVALKDIAEGDAMLQQVNSIVDHLRQFVCGRILWCHSIRLSIHQQNQGNDHRRIENYLRPYEANFGLIYDTLTDSEKILTKFFWRNLRDLEWNINCLTSIPSMNSHPSYSYEGTMQKVNQYGIKPVTMTEILFKRDNFNRLIMESINDHKFKGGVTPNEAIFRQFSYTHQPVDLMEEEISGITEIWEKKDPWTKRDDGTLAIAMKISEEQEKSSIKSVSAEGETSPSSSRGVMNFDFDFNFPMRPKVLDEVPVLEKTHMTPVDVSKRSTVNALGETKESFVARLHKTFDNLDKSTSNSRAQSNPQYTPVGNQFADGLSAQPTIIDSLMELVARNSKDTLPTYSRLLRPHAGSTGKSEMHLPTDNDIGQNSPFFSIGRFMQQVEGYVHALCDKMLYIPQELDWIGLTDTLLCLSDEEFKYLPLWAGGNEDGSGGVYDAMIPPAATGTGPSGPGPAFHTGYTVNSAASTELDFSDSSTVVYTERTFNTSVAVENGYSDYIDRRVVMSDDGFRSETFSEDNDNYLNKGKGKEIDVKMTGNSTPVVSDDELIYVGKGKGKGKGKVDSQLSSNSTPMNFNDDDQIYVGKGKSKAVDVIMSGALTPKDVDEEEDFNFSDEEEDFDFGDDDAEEDEDRMGLICIQEDTWR
jgi:hypothetical protein